MIVLSSCYEDSCSYDFSHCASLHHPSFDETIFPLVYTIPIIHRVLGQVLPSTTAALNALLANQRRWEQLKQEGRKTP